MRDLKTARSIIGILLVVCIVVCGCGQQETDTDTDKFAENPVVSYLGPEGTYTEEAAHFFFNDKGTFVPETTVQEAIEDVLTGKADYAVIPQENALGGAVVNYVDELIAQEDTYVVGEVILPISQTLMGVPGASIDDIRMVCSHAQGLTQSEDWRKEHLPDAETQEMSSTAEAARYVAESNDKTIAAVAAPGAAKLYGLSVLAENVQITDANKTRFYVLSAERFEEGHTNAVFVARCEAGLIDDIILEVHNADVLEPHNVSECIGINDPLRYLTLAPDCGVYTHGGHLHAREHALLSPFQAPLDLVSRADTIGIQAGYHRYPYWIPSCSPDMGREGRSPARSELITPRSMSAVCRRA